MNENETLREQMWELVYGLTSPEETALLHRQIKSDPAVARLYAQVRLQADLVASAALVEDVDVPLSVPDECRKVQPVHTSPATFSRKQSISRGNVHRGANWLAGIAAAALVVLLGYGYFYSPDSALNSHEDLVVAKLYAPARLNAGLSQNLKVKTEDSSGKPAAASVRYHVRDSHGNVTWQDSLQIGADGNGELRLPGNVIQPGTQVEVFTEAPRFDTANNLAVETAPTGVSSPSKPEATFEQTAAPALVAALSVAEEPVSLNVTFDKDYYVPGETIRFRAVALSAWSRTESDGLSNRWNLYTPDGSQIAATQVRIQPEHGVVVGEFHVPANYMPGFYSIKTQGIGDQDEVERQVVAVGASSALSLSEANSFALAPRGMQLNLLASDKKDKQESRHTGLLRNNQQSISGSAPAAAQPRPDEVGRKSAVPDAIADTPAPPSPASVPAEEPATVPPEQAKGGKAEVANEASTESLPAKEEKEEVASKKLMKQYAVREQLKDSGVPKVDGYKQSSPLPQSLDELNRTAEDFLRLSIPEPALGRKLLVVAECRGVVVATKEVEVPAVAGEDGRFLKRTADAPLELPIPPEADGEIVVSFFDASTESRELLQRQTVVRHGPRELQVELVDALDSYHAGDTVRLKMHVKDLEGDGVPLASLGVRMVANSTEEERGEDFDRSRFSFTPGALSATVPTLEDSTASGSGKGAEDLAKFGLKDAASKEVLLGMAAETQKPTTFAAPGGAPGGGQGNEEAVVEDDSKNRAEDESLPRPEMARHLTESSIEEATMPLAVEPGEDHLLASNQDSVSAVLQKERAEEGIRQADFRGMLGRILLASATALLVLLAALAVLHRAAQAKVWIPALGIVTACFAVGFVWMMAGGMKGSQQKMVASAPDMSLEKTSLPIRMPAAPAPGGMGGGGGIQGTASSDVAEALLPQKDEPAPASFDATGGPSDPAELFKEGGEAAGPAGDRSGGNAENPAGGEGKPRESRSKEVPPESPEGPNDLQQKTQLQAKMLPVEKAAEGSPPPGAVEAKQQDLRFPPATKKSGTTPEKPSGAGFAGGRAMPGKSLAESPRGEFDKGDLKQAVADKKKKNDADKEAEIDLARRDIMNGVRQRNVSQQSLLWEPLLIADENGMVEIEVQLPPGSGNYSLIVDVHGKGGVGELRKEITVQDQPLAAPAQPAAPAPTAEPAFRGRNP